MKKAFKEWLQVVFGLLIFSVGIHFTIQADIGLAPWDCLGMGVAKHTPLNYGMTMTLISVVILIIDLLMKENIGFGTILDAFLTGNFINFFITYSPFHPNNIATSILMIVIGLVFANVGQFFYMKAGQGCGPRDSFLVGLGKRLHRISIGTVNIIIYVTVFTIGWLLGGPAGLGTIITVLFTGVIMDFVFRLLRFEPRSIRHRNVGEMLHEIREGR